MNKKIALIGYGIQGEAVATRLTEAGYSISVFDTDVERIKLASTRGLSCANSFVEVITEATYILLTLTAGAASRELLLHSSNLESLKSKQCVVQMGTTSVKDSLELNRELSQRKIRFVESILSGPSSAVMVGACPLLVGTEKSYLKELELVFQSIGPLFYIGEVGKAAAFNLASLNMIYAIFQNFAVSTALIERSDIELEVWLNHVRSGFGLQATNLLKVLTDFLWPVHFKNRNYQLMGPLQFKANGAANETEVIQDFIKDLRLNSLLIEGINEVQKTARLDNPNNDWTAFYEVLVPK